MNIPDLKKEKGVENFLMLYAKEVFKQERRDLKIIGLPTNEFVQVFKKFVDKKNEFEKDFGYEYATNVVYQYIRSVSLDHKSYDQIKAILPNSNYMAKVNRDLYSLTTYYVLLNFSANKVLIDKSLSECSESQLEDYQKRANGLLTGRTFNEVHNAINAHVGFVKKLAEIEDVNIDNILKFMTDNNSRVKKELFLSEDYWDFLQKKGNENNLVEEWSELFSPYIYEMINFRKGRDNIEDLYKFLDKLPIYLFEESFMFKNTDKMVKFTEYGMFKDTAKDFLEYKKRVIRENDLLKELNKNNKEKIVDRRKKI